MNTTITTNRFRVGDRVELCPSTDWWMRGARYGEVTRVCRYTVHVRLDATGRVVRLRERQAEII